jgi:hypothetical protein
MRPPRISEVVFTTATRFVRCHNFNRDGTRCIPANDVTRAVMAVTARADDAQERMRVLLETARRRGVEARRGGRPSVGSALP